MIIAPQKKLDKISENKNLKFISPKFVMKSDPIIRI